MKNLFRFLVGMVVVAVLMASASASLAEQVKKGDSAIVMEKEYVEVKNPEPIRNSNRTFVCDKGCNIKKGGKIIVVGKIQRESYGYVYPELLVRYQIAGKQKGNNCPSGTVFFISENSFGCMKTDKEKHDKYLADKAREKDAIKKLLSNK